MKNEKTLRQQTAGRNFAKKSCLIAIVALSGFASAQASCDEEDIETVGGGGQIIVLQDGSVWESLDPATSVTWLPADTVLVCDNGKMINKDENGETVDVIPQ